jgi:hypothetical protein
LFQFLLAQSLDRPELAPGDVQKFKLVYFGGVFAQQMSVEYQFCGVLFFEDAVLSKKFEYDHAVASR